MIRQNQHFFQASKLLADFLLILLSYPIAWFLRFNLFAQTINQSLPLKPDLIQLILFAVFFLLLLSFFNLYNSRKIMKLYDEMARLLLAHVTGVLLVLFVLYLAKEMDLSRWFIFTYFACSFLLICIARVIERFLIKACARRGLFTAAVVLAGTPEVIHDYYVAVRKNRRYGINVRFVLGTGEKPCEDMPLDGRFADLDRILAEETDIEQVVIGLKLADYPLLKPMIDTCEKHGVKSSIIPDYQQYLPARPYYDVIDNVTLVHTRMIPLDFYINKLLKRTVDLAGALVLLIACLPLYLIIALLIRLTSHGPVIFRQKRVGYNKKEFVMYKFRTMTVQDPQQEIKQWSTRKDSRVTGVGRILRKTSLDETPQFYNVLIGNMSLVGPRPERRKFVDRFSEQIPKYNLKHRVKPGITGLAQVHGCRGDTSLTQRIRYDLYYVENWSIQMDLYILFRTALYGFFNRSE